jgi:hypothetical protein
LGCVNGVCSCVDDPFCAAGEFCNGVSCESIHDLAEPCTGDAIDVTGDHQCTAGLQCVAGLCTCVDDAFCGAGNYCDGLACPPLLGPGAACGPDSVDATGDHQCAAGLGCAGECVQACSAEDITIPSPNMLIVLDRSGSMTQNMPAVGNPCTVPPGIANNPSTRFMVAVNVISQVTAAYETRLRFGLLTFPLPPPPICQIGGMNVPIGDLAHVPINDYLCSVALSEVGGQTPTGQTLEALDVPTVGLDDPDRGNFIVLLTDGDALCNGFPTEGDTANAAIASLHARTPPVDTFVVGLAFGPVSTLLNCNAINGGRSLCTSVADCAAIGTDDIACQMANGCMWDGINCVGGIDASNCKTANNAACYYDARDPATLSDAFADITARVSACAAVLSARPSGVPNSAYSVYLDYGSTAPRVLLSTTLNAPEGWWYLDDANDRVVFFGQACTDIQNQTAVAAVYYGCP